MVGARFLSLVSVSPMMCTESEVVGTFGACASPPSALRFLDAIVEEMSDCGKLKC